ncbi:MULTISPECIES: alpha-glutamyl/putrescinyl thymine pyrophosphorylase clade 3 protein [Enterobacteriaceae]|uniref:alpha-glutamyl/putrescinyl thymine pyrophosphorylase clade 3 protein n=1 Tax=Enterobacteriaceae TaxID=543 RepID=UPI000796E6EB|nr:MULTISPECIES: hypothetical protein [Enterobacteriaceae]BCT12474.1 hypothetical protein R1TS_05020 [Enterobacter cloacae]HAV7781253.1 hypothetical protein [Escherichia coli]HCR1888035.1 hypothetical protein [Enterobacter roggenkampii]MBW9453165.1 hypothetical protein [Citrobacter portucalensis]MBW9457129.1 hypothetical protein [Citrobacter portucalensis]
MKRHNQISQLVVSLQNFSRNEHNLNGLSSPACFDVLACQIIDSIRRIRYVETLALRTDYMTPLRKEPNSDIFDPLRAACLHLRDNNYDEACWLVFLATHFGKSNKTGWILCRDIYSGLGTQTWTWDTITDDFAAFEQWFASVSDELTANSGLRQYGNHRKYETKKYHSRRSIPAVFRSYIGFIGATHSHEARFAEAKSFSSSPESLFELLYSGLNAVISFGRTAKFDYLTMLKKTGLLDAEPGHAFLNGATGPLQGSRLLFSNSRTAGDTIDVLNEKLADLAAIIPAPYLRMQVIEDALCNWQKSPDRYVYFGG